MARDFTAAEKVSFAMDFPRLDVNRMNIVTAESTGTYNCFSWSVGITTRWNNVRTVREADRFYAEWGFTRVRPDRGQIALMGANFLNIKHGFRKVRGVLPRWSSKCGRNVRISHKLKELESSSYGRVLAHYGPRRLPVPGGGAFRLSALASGVLNETSVPQLALTKRDRRILQQDIKAVPGKLKESFSERFNAWKQDWPQVMRFSSDVGVVTCLDTFHPLLALGEEALPLLVDQLCDPENFPALQLYELMQTDSALVYEYEDDDETIIEGEQGRALNTVLLWIENR